VWIHAAASALEVEPLAPAVLGRRGSEAGDGSRQRSATRLDRGDHLGEVTCHRPLVRGSISLVPSREHDRPKPVHTSARHESPLGIAAHRLAIRFCPLLYYRRSCIPPRSRSGPLSGLLPSYRHDHAHPEHEADKIGTGSPPPPCRDQVRQQPGELSRDTSPAPVLPSRPPPAKPRRMRFLHPGDHLPADAVRGCRPAVASTGPPRPGRTAHTRHKRPSSGRLWPPARSRTAPSPSASPRGRNPTFPATAIPSGQPGTDSSAGPFSVFRASSSACWSGPSVSRAVRGVGVVSMSLPAGVPPPGATCGVA